MRRWFVSAAMLAMATIAMSQETKVGELPRNTVGGTSAHRYSTCQTGCGAVIPMCTTREVLCDVVESLQKNKRVEEWVTLALSQVGTLNNQDVFVSFIELCRESGGPPHLGHWQGDEMQYASSFAKVFYGTALMYELQDNKIPMTGAMCEDLRCMLFNNDNAATNRLVDWMSGTESGERLGYAEFCSFAKKRDYTNWYFTNVGFRNFNVDQKIFTMPPSGRDLQLLGNKLPLNYENSNRVTTNQMAALLYLIQVEKIVSPDACQIMKQYMYRPVEQRKLQPLQGIAWGLPVGSKLVSLTGYTNHNYHEAAIVTLPNHKQYILSVMTKYRNYPTMFIPILSQIIADWQMERTGDREPSEDFLDSRPLTGY